MPGVQVLFAFLLTVPFSQRSNDLTQLQQYVFFVSLLCTTAAALLLIAPSAHQRTLWHQGEREPNLRIENKLNLAGLIFLGPAMSGSIFLITDLVFDLVIASAVTTVMMALLCGYGLLCHCCIAHAVGVVNVTIVLEDNRQQSLLIRTGMPLLTRLPGGCVSGNLFA